jgi:hypothetical protein
MNLIYGERRQWFLTVFTVMKSDFVRVSNHFSVSVCLREKERKRERFSFLHLSQLPPRWCSQIMRKKSFCILIDFTNFADYIHIQQVWQLLNVNVSLKDWFIASLNFRYSH